MVKGIIHIFIKIKISNISNSFVWRQLSSFSNLETYLTEKFAGTSDIAKNVKWIFLSSQ